MLCCQKHIILGNRIDGDILNKEFTSARLFGVWCNDRLGIFLGDTEASRPLLLKVAISTFLTACLGLKWPGICAFPKQIISWLGPIPPAD